MVQLLAQQIHLAGGELRAKRRLGLRGRRCGRRCLVTLRRCVVGRSNLVARQVLQQRVEGGRRFVVLQIVQHLFEGGRIALLRFRARHLMRDPLRLGQVPGLETNPI